MKKIKKTFVNIIGLFIWHRPTRHRVRDWMMQFRIMACVNYIKYILHPVRENSVLLMEFNDCHGEVIGGMIKYLQKMGFHIDILLNEKVYAEHPFCRLDMQGVRIYKTYLWGQKMFLRAKKTQKYRDLMLMTSACYFITKPDGGYGCMLPLFNGTGLRPIVIEHDLNDVQEFGEQEIVCNHRLITLGKFAQGTFVNPHLFGAVKKSPKNQTTTFITVGNLEPKRKNFKMLVDAIEKLARGGKDFKVIIIGRGEIGSIPPEIHRFIEITGRLNFPKMFEKIESADFFLPLLDSQNPAHDRYLTSGVTGSAQLIYGFAKVPVINKKFATFYRFDNTNAIVYDDDFADAMNTAIEMSATEYAKIQQNLQHTATDIENESLNNLKGILNNAK